MNVLIEHIDQIKKEFQELQPLSPENQKKLDKKFRLEWNFNSNHIEGNTLTYGETELLLMFDHTKGNHELREYEEMKNHDVALKLVYELANDKERNLTENFIREINQVILVRPFYKESITLDGQPTKRLIKIGEYKSFANRVRLSNGEIFEYPSPIETPSLMNDMVTWYRAASNDTNQYPVEVAAELHYHFVSIHPFDDGNGRIARLLMNYHLIKNDYLPVIIKSEDKRNYLFTLHEADTGNIEAFKRYIGEQLLWSYEISIKAAKGENIDEPEDWRKKIEILKKDLPPEKKLENKKSIESIHFIIKESYGPLLYRFMEKVESLYELFFEKAVKVKVSNIGECVSKEYNEVMEFLSGINTNNITFINSQFQFINFKNNGLKLFDVNVNIKFLIFEYNYEVSNTSTFQKEVIKYHHQKLSTVEIEEITNSAIGFILEKIQEEIKSHSIE